MAASLGERGDLTTCARARDPLRDPLRTCACAHVSVSAGQEHESFLSLPIEDYGSPGSPICPALGSGRLAKAIET